jgi:HSP20 family protein
MALEMWRPRSGLARRSASADPFRAMDEMMNRFFEDWTTAPRGIGTVRGWAPAIDMADRENEILLRADLPGLEQKDINVNLENGVLTIRGERKEEREAREEDYFCCERWSGSFSRSVTLPQGIDADKVQARFKNGVLEIKIPKTKQAVGKKIEIQQAA